MSTTIPDRRESCAPLSLSTLNPGMLRGFPPRRPRFLQRLADLVRALLGGALAQGR